MTDKVDPATRSRNMAAIRARDTGPELALRRALVALGVRGYRLHRRDVPGRPDLAWPGRRVAVFVDGAFWHGHPSAYKRGKSGDFWDRKIGANIEHDRRIDIALRSAGWTVLRLWDFEIEADVTACAEQVRAMVGRGS
jgi:DNA mismatch endonuclease (patch repair protein)